MPHNCHLLSCIRILCHTSSILTPWLIVICHLCLALCGQSSITFTTIVQVMQYMWTCLILVTRCFQRLVLGLSYLMAQSLTSFSWFVDSILLLLFGNKAQTYIVLERLHVFQFISPIWGGLATRLSTLSFESGYLL